MNNVQTETVKIYFIEPIHLISVVIDTLIKLNFEAYSIEGAYKEKLISILKTNPRNVIYICILGDASVEEWLHYIDELQVINQSQIQVGAFIFNKMPLETRTQFLERGIATIPFEHLKNDTLQTLKKILTYFEAGSKKKYVSAATFGICQASFQIRGQPNPIQTDMLSLSVYAFSCYIKETDRMQFGHGNFFNEVTLLLRGRRVIISAKFMGFGRENPQIGIFKIYMPSSPGSVNQYHNQLTQDVKNKLYDAIKSFLKDNLKKKLDTIQ
ncbi:MAG: hypothetical protein JW822_04485 [Spirochaetales bacterium]|nr:hypothetical protein [Spirochaetales bacterium]